MSLGPKGGWMTPLVKKRAQRSLVFVLFVGCALSYYQAFVVLGGKILAIESSLPPEISSVVFLSQAGPAQGELDAEALEREWNIASSLFNVAIPELPGIPGVLGRIARSARSLGIEGVMMETRERVPAENLSAEIPVFAWPIRLRLTSEYVQLAQFVHALQSMPRVAEVLALSMKRYPPGVASEIRLAVYSQTAPSLLRASKLQKKRPKKIPEDSTDDFDGPEMIGEMESGENVAE